VADAKAASMSGRGKARSIELIDTGTGVTNVSAPALSDAEYLANIGDLWGRGWSVIPLEFGGKRPAIASWTEYQTRPATFEELESWFGGEQRHNIGVVTGHVSGIFVLDADSPEAMAWCVEHMPVTEMRVRTAKGVHLYYPLSADARLRNKTRIQVGTRGRIGLDVRADGGYVVGPGSTHPSGIIYTREGDGWGRL
jgi:hypothetical protein